VTSSDALSFKSLGCAWQKVTVHASLCSSITVPDSYIQQRRGAKPHNLILVTMQGNTRAQELPYWSRQSASSRGGGGATIGVIRDPQGNFHSRCSLCLFPFSFTFYPSCHFIPSLSSSHSVFYLLFFHGHSPLTHNFISFSDDFCLSLFPILFPYFSRLLFLSSAVPPCPLYVFTSCKGKGKIVLVLAQALRYEAIGDNRGMAPRILNLGFRWERVFVFTPRLLYPRYPLDRLDVPQGQSGRCGRPIWESCHTLSIMQPVVWWLHGWAVSTIIVKFFFLLFCVCVSHCLAVLFLRHYLSAFPASLLHCISFSPIGLNVVMSRTQIAPHW